MTSRFDPAGWMLGAAVLGAAVVGAVWVEASGDRPPSAGSVADRVGVTVGARPSVSDDGRWVVYEGRPSADDGRSSTAWLVDRGSAVGAGPVELTVPDEQIRPGDSVRPVISGDGCVVAVVTQFAFDLFRDDDRGTRWDVYRRVLPHCGGPDEWELVSSTSAEGSSALASDAASADEAPALSWSGTTVAYTQRGAAGSPKLGQVRVVDLTLPMGDPTRVTAVPGVPATGPDNGFVHRGQFHPDLSADGRVVVFAADTSASDDGPVWAEGAGTGEPAVAQVHRWDRDAEGVAGTVELVSVVGGRPARGGGANPVVSADGRYVAYESSSPDLVGDTLDPPCDSVCPTQVVRFDAERDTTTVVGSGVGDPPAGGGRTPTRGLVGGAWAPSISSDGRLISFVTRDRDLFPVRSELGPALRDGDVVVADVERGELTRVSVRPDGVTPLSATNSSPAMSASGHVVLFDTLAGTQLDAAAVLSGDATAGGRQVALASRPAALVPASLDVGTVRVGAPGPEWYVAVRNEGPATFVPARVTVSDARFSVTGGTCALGVPVPAGGSCTVYLVLTPDATGPIAASVTVTDELYGGSSSDIAVSGAGGEPMLDPTPAGADFAPTVVGRAAPTIAFDIANIGFQPDGVVDVALAGRNPSDFVVQSTSCSGVLLYPTTSCSVEVRFQPTDSGFRSAVLTLTSATGATTSVVLSGTGTRVVAIEALHPRVRPGEDAVLVGTGFPAGASVTVSWADGRGRSATVVAGADGAILANLPTRVNERRGERTIVASVGALTAETSVEVLRRRTSTPFGT